MLPDLKRSTLRNVMLQCYKKKLNTSKKTISSFLGKRLSHDTGRLWIAVSCCWSNISVIIRDSSTKTQNTPSLQGDRHLVSSRATSGFTLPSRHSYFLPVGNFCFHKYKNQKTIFILDFISFSTVSRSFMTLE